MKHTDRKGSSLQRGQSFVELALGLVFFLFILIGMFDLGRAYYIYVALKDSANEAALYLAVNHTCPVQYPPEEDKPECNDPNNAWYRAKNASSLQISWDSVTITQQYYTDAVAGDMVKVRMEYPFSLLTPIISNIVGSNTLKLGAEASHVILKL